MASFVPLDCFPERIGMFHVHRNEGDKMMDGYTAEAGAHDLFSLLHPDIHKAY